MTEKESKALEIIEPYLADIKKFQRSRTLQGNRQLLNALAEAYYILTNDELTKKKLSSGAGCGACTNRAVNALYRLYEQSLLERTTERDTKKDKPKRGRPRKQNKPTD